MQIADRITLLIRFIYPFLAALTKVLLYDISSYSDPAIAYKHLFYLVDSTITEAIFNAFFSKQLIYIVASFIRYFLENCDFLENSNVPNRFLATQKILEFNINAKICKFKTCRFFNIGFGSF